MCLNATSERDRGGLPPPDTVAWKVVYKRTREPYWRVGNAPYKRGSKHLANPKRIRAQRSGNSYSFGLHVFTTLGAARVFRDIYGGACCIIIRVRVSPRNWIASSPTEAVYSRLEVLT